MMQEHKKELDKICKQMKIYDSSILVSESADFIYSNRQDLLREYLGYWIAVYKQEVIAFNKDLLHLVRTLRKGKIPLQYISIDRLSSEEMPVVL